MRRLRAYGILELLLTFGIIAGLSLFLYKTVYPHIQVKAAVLEHYTAINTHEEGTFVDKTGKLKTQYNYLEEKFNAAINGK